MKQMKQLFCLPLLLASAATFAQPYITVGYGAASISHDKVTTFKDGVTLSPSGSDGIAMATIGYKISDNFGLEFSYSQFDQESQLNGPLSVAGSGASAVLTQTKWESELRANQFAIKPAFFLPLGDRFTLKATAGLSYNMYKTSSRNYTEKESVLDVDFDVPIETIPTEKEGTVGLIAGAGAYMRLYQGLSIGVEANYSYDKIVSATQVFGTLNYQF